jgi:hypothetical protein
MDMPADNWTPIQIAYGTGNNPTNWTGYSASVPYTLDIINETKTIYVKAKDAGGNISSYYTDTILFDNQAPYS